MVHQTRKEKERIIENYLKDYKTYKVGLKSLQKQLDYILPNTTASYELIEGSTGTFNIKSSTEKYAIDRIESKKALNIYENIERYKLIIESIEEALKDLDETERKYVELFYIEKKKVAFASRKVGYTTTSVYGLRKRIFDKLLISLKVLIEL